MSFNEIVEANGSETDRGMIYTKFENDRVYFKEYDSFTNQWFEHNSSPYFYTKTDSNTATLISKITTLGWF